MVLIRIQERSAGSDGPNAILSFDYGAEYPITIYDPFSEEKEQHLEWYFEQWLRFPFLNQVKAQAAAQSILTYGEKLFSQVFSDSEAYVTYRNAVQAGLSTVQIEIAGPPTFHRWHWEALKDPRLPQPLALQATMVRRNLMPQVVRATLPPSPTINLLIVTARPGGAKDVGYRTISRPLVEAMRRANLPVQIDLVRPGTYRALLDHLEEVKVRQQERGEPGGYYHVLHFDVHGALLSYEAYQQLQQQYRGERLLMETPYGRRPLTPYEDKKAFLFLQSEQEETTADPVEAGQLADLLINYQIPIAILNACQSGKQVGTSETSLGSRLMQAGVQLVLAMGYSVTVSAAELLMRTLYQQLFAKQELSTAIRRGRQELYNRKERRAYFNQTIELEDWLLPVVYQNQAQRLAVRDFTAEEAASFYGRQAARYKPSEPGYGFVGRDMDILQLEKQLLTKRNLVLVQGMGGAGKTTLLQHLGSWWQTTGLVEQVFYFGYDEQAWSRQQLLHRMAEQLLGQLDYLRVFQPLSLEAQQALLSERLRAKRHLLILDNLESITGTQLAIQHTLPPEEQQALHSLLTDLAGGQTPVLLGSRGGEDWLARGTFEDNVYELGGLDPEAASTLADRILERNRAMKYRRDADLQKLLKVLDGFPLALEVVLANLARQTPTEVLSALQAGDVTLDTGDTQKKTESILRSIDYSHSNLSPEAQALLTCMTPFTSVINLSVLDAYATYLRKQPALAALPFKHWQEVLQEITNWGLLSPDPDIPYFLHLQPVLPYFLRSRLSMPEQAEMRYAVETAFRQLYDLVGNDLANLLRSKESQERQWGQVLTDLEYENLVTALNLALAAQDSILNPYNALAAYLDAIHDQHRALKLDETMLSRLESYSADKLAGLSGYELAGVLEDIARRQLNLKQYTMAEASYQKVLRLVTQSEYMDKKLRGKLQAGVYHELGRVAEEQRQWEQAEQYYQQALQIKIDFNDRYDQASTYHTLGGVAQGQRQWQQAEQYYQQALQIYIDFNDRYNQAGMYHEWGLVAQRQGKWQQAEQDYQQALQIYIDFNDRYNQARTYHQLGTVAQEQRQWEQAEQYYQQALQIEIESNDRYEQAGTYHQLGQVAQERGQWEQARNFFLPALETFVDSEDDYNSSIVLGSLARLWQASNDARLPATIAPTVNMSPAEVEELLHSLLDNGTDEPSS